MMLGFTKDMLLSINLVDLETNIVMRIDSILNINKLVDGSIITDILN